MKSISKPDKKTFVGNGFLDPFTSSLPTFPPSLSVPPQLTAQKHKNSKYRVWHIEACSTWWSLPLPVVPPDLGADRLCEQDFRKACKGRLRSWILITLQRVTGIFVYQKNHFLIF